MSGASVLVLGVNSYVELDDADDMAKERYGPRIDAWTALTATKREATLMQATRDIDAVAWLGYKTERDQALEFPRGDSSIPGVVQEACLEQACHLALTASSAERREELSRAGVRSASVGGISEHYAGGSAAPLCYRAMALLRRYHVTGAVLI